MRLLLSSLIVFLVTPYAGARPSGNFMGGVSGGGGNIMTPKAPTAPVSSEIAEHIVYDSYPTLVNYVNQKKNAFAAKQLPVEQMQAFSPLFESDGNIERVMSHVRLHVVDDRSCWDAQKNPVDGSTISHEPNSICISAFNIANKTEVADIAPQSVALMLHEYSELIGLNEEQAVRAQATVLQELRGF